MVLAVVKKVASITVNGEILEQVLSFVYLGATFTENSSCSQGIWKRLVVGHSVVQSYPNMEA